MLPANVIAFPARRSLSEQDRALIARWAAAARQTGISKVYVSGAHSRDTAGPPDRLLIVENPTAGARWVLYRPARHWILTCGRSAQEMGVYTALRDALHAVRPFAATAPL